ncbi:DUF421 domain-containing protein [Pedobacter sp. MC2016-15]|uniref:DUF421 domain-containing protein n=1 Tax=Pedobacter sp. MC2016-15 TaxID=2994473 RepID=UPI002246740A|nr:YetF domain-containing protein [Pedobacter sp. MC2016-15]MCX2478240.1 DUF421 domain-containing protein [Pedobacter sp. MC2016-15]
MEVDWNNVFMKGLDLSLLIEISVRTSIMFFFVIVFLRSTGKKGVRQLSIFEVAIIIALGSAAGDPMLNSESAILPSLLVFALILLIYRIFTYLASRNEKIESLLEGDPMYIIEDGKFVLEQDGDSNFARDEFFAEMRAQSIEHVGQVRTGVLESNGQISFLYYAQDEVKKGLPVFPKPYGKKSTTIPVPGDYACTHCAEVHYLGAGQDCPRCGEKEWVPAISTVRTV